MQYLLMHCVQEEPGLAQGTEGKQQQHSSSVGLTAEQPQHSLQPLPFSTAPAPTAAPDLEHRHGSAGTGQHCSAAALPQRAGSLQSTEKPYKLC